MCLDGSIVEISYIGLEERINASDKIPYTIYKFEGYQNRTFGKMVKFELHTDITDNKVQMNIHQNGGMTFGSVYVDTVKDRDALINYFIEEIKRY
jgi:hypothetical protein